MKRALKPLLFLCSALFLVACQSSSAVVSKHFAELTEIAKAYPNDCEGMGNALVKYLDANGEEIRRAMRDTGNATGQEANEVFRTSLQLHEATHGCMNDSVEAFRAKLADMTLTLTSNPS